MITPQTIGNILYQDSKALGIEHVFVVFPATTPTRFLPERLKRNVW